MNNRPLNQVQPYWNNSLAIRQEIQRFESVHPSIYAIYDLIESIPDPVLGQQIRDHVVCIEGNAHVKVSCCSDSLRCSGERVRSSSGSRKGV